MANHMRSDGKRPTRRQAPVRRSAGTVRAGAVTRRVSSRTAKRTGAVGAVRSKTPRTTAPASKGHIAIAAMAVAAIVAILAVVGFALSSCGPKEPAPSAPAQQQPDSNSIEVQIPEGAGGDVIASRLVEAGVIKNAKTYYTTVANLKADALLKPGTYVFTKGMTPEEVVHLLMAGPNSSKGKLTLAEGLNVEKTAEAVEKSLGIPKDEFLAQAKASNYVDDYPFLEPAADDSLEGFLWGATYEFSGKEVTADAVIRAMLDRFAKETASIDFDTARTAIQKSYGVQMSNYDILKLASVIEKEAVTEKDRPLVSSVFYNRLRDGMPLQSDATMMYVTGGEVTAEDLKIESPYNSYLNKGLPPTPICTPSLACIEAALSPASTGYYYFLIIENGNYSNHTFSKTYDEHLAAIEKAKADQAA